MKLDCDGEALLRRWESVAASLLRLDRVAFIFLLRAAELATEDLAVELPVSSAANSF